MKKILTIATTFFAILLMAEEFTDVVLARVGDTVITAYDIRMATAQDEATIPQNIPLQERMAIVTKLRSEALEEQILNELVWTDFQELKAKMPKEYLQERVDQIIRARANANEERFRDMLHRDNLTYKDFEESIAKRLAIDMLLYDRTRRNIFVTTEQIRNYFVEHAQDFAKETRFHILAIQLPKEGNYKEIVAEIRVKLADGADFNDLARQYSKGANAENGGDLGWMTSMAPALEKVVLPLKSGEIVQEDLEIGNSVYLIKLQEREGGEEVELTQEIENKIKKILEDVESNKKREEYLQSLYMKYPVRRYE